MGESLTQRRRVSDEGLRVVKLCRMGKKKFGEQYLRILTVLVQKALANSVPAAAVIRRVLALFGIIGRKARVGGMVCRV
jgi:hypothetical protein